MFTILWRIDAEREELYSAVSISKIPAVELAQTTADCGGRAHVAFQAFTAIQDSDKPALHRKLIDSGDVFVMNAEGKTVATYRF